MIEEKKEKEFQMKVDKIWDYLRDLYYSNDPETVVMCVMLFSISSAKQCGYSKEYFLSAMEDNWKSIGDLDHEE